MTFRKLGAGALLLTACMMAAGAQVPASADTTTVALWHMDEPAGSPTMVDSSGLGNDGTPQNVVQGQPGVTNADADSTDFAYSFDGVTSSVRVPNSPSLVAGDAGFTISASVQLAQLPSPTHDYDLVRKGLAGKVGGEFKMEIRDKGQGYCLFKGSSGKQTIRKGPNLADGLWHTLQCVKTDTAIQLVVDGVTFSKAANVGSISNVRDLIVGAKPGDDFFNGVMDELRVDVQQPTDPSAL